MPVRKTSPFDSLLKKRIPTILGLAILVVGVVAGIYLVGNDTGGFLPRASEDAVPKQVRITNITDTGFTVSFITDEVAPGYVQHGTSQNRMSTQARDDRDQLANTANNYLTHHVSVRGLEPATQYYFRIGTGGRTTYDNNGQPFNVRTARRQTDTSEAMTAYGTVSTEVGNPADGAIVYLSIAGASPVSALVKSNGSWAMPLTGLRTADLSALQSIVESDAVRIQVQGTRRGEVIDHSATVAELAPLVPLVFGQEPGSNTSPQPTMAPEVQPTPPTQSSTDNQTGTFGSMFTNQEAETTTNTTGSVNIRLDEGEMVNTARPEFNGVAPANAYLQIEVHSDEPHYGVVQSDASGQWQWAPPKDLSPGEHTVTVTYTDENGQQQKVQRTFLVLADTSNNLPAFTSTPSGSLATPTPTPQPTLIAQASPTPVPTALPTATPIPTPFATPTVVATTSAQPVSGSETPTLLLTAIAAVFFSAGAGLAWRTSAYTRKQTW